MLQKAVQGPDEPLDETRILHTHKGAVVLGGGAVTMGGLRRAGEVGVKALVAASAHGQDLLELLGGKLNPSATGNEDMGFTLVLTEGFGELGMGPRSFELLARLDGVNVAVNGATQIRAGVLRPEVISHGLKLELGTKPHTAQVEVGDRVRIVVPGIQLTKLSIKLYLIPLIIALVIIYVTLNIANDTSYSEWISVGVASFSLLIYYITFSRMNKKKENESLHQIILSKLN